MNRIRYDIFGTPEVLKVERVPVPIPGPGEILMRVEACDVNFSDSTKRRGIYHTQSPVPHFPGASIAGTIVKLGSGVHGLDAHARVAGYCGTGGYAQFQTLPAERVFPLPAAVSYAQAVTALSQGFTAMLMTKRFPIPPRSTVLITAAAGGIGTYLIQLARLREARVVAVTSSVRKMEKTRALGAFCSVDSSQPDWDKKAFLSPGELNMIFDSVGGEVLLKSMNQLADFGVVITYGNASRETVRIDPKADLRGNKMISNFSTNAFRHQGNTNASVSLELLEMIGTNRLQAIVSHSFPLSRAADAHRLLEAREAEGSIVLTPWSE